MFTQCYKCETVFRLSAEALRAAGGQVRCGRCGEVFNALARLAEDASGFSQGESSFELETRADAILGTLEPVSPAATTAAGVGDLSQLTVLDPIDEELSSEASLEFTLPPGELDRIFIETTPSVLQVLAADAHRTARNVHRPLPPPMPEATPESVRDPAPAPAALEPQTTVQPPRIAGLEVSEDVRKEMMSSYAHAELPEINAPRREIPHALWVTAAGALALLLAAQLLLTNREWLAANVPLLGGVSASSAKLSAYQLRQWGVTGDPGAAGTLRVRATILNAAAQLQPYPLLRVTLANRFGTRVAQREFEPSEYLGKVTSHMLSPGERVEAVLDIVDPGKEAEGFEIDVCVRGFDQKLKCAGETAATAAAQGKK